MPSVTALRTIRIAERANLLWLEIETDEGLTGLGESFRGSQAVEAVIHEQVAPYLLGKDARQIEGISRHLVNPYVGFQSSGAEIRAASAVDMALWDLMGQRHGVPLYVALGGAVRESIRVYNTCAGYSYNTSGARRAVGTSDAVTGPYDDQVAFMRDAGTLAESLLSEDYAAMKIWPFDVYADATGGHMISLSDLNAGLEPFRKIRRAVGDRIDVMCEMHSLWTSHAAERICRALEEFGVFWAEDPIGKMTDVTALTDLRRRTRTPICASETLGGVVPFRDLLAGDAVRRRDARLVVVRRPHARTQDRRAGGGVRASVGAARLHRTCRADGRIAPGVACANGNLPGSSACRAEYLVSRARHRPARGSARHGPRAAGGRAGYEARSQRYAARGRDDPRQRCAALLMREATTATDVLHRITLRAREF